MSKAVCKDVNKNGVNPSLYDPRNKFYNIDFSCNPETMEALLRKQDTLIAFSHCIRKRHRERELTDYMLGNFYFDSLLSYYLQAVDFSYKVLSNI